MYLNSSRVHREIKEIQGRSWGEKKKLHFLDVEMEAAVNQPLLFYLDENECQKMS